MKLSSVILSLLICLGSLFLFGCEEPRLYSVADQNTQDMQNRLRRLDNRVIQRAPDVIEKRSAYVDLQPIPLNRYPAWMNRPIELHGQNLPFHFFAERLVNSAHAFSNYQQGLNVNRSISMNYSGSVRGALDKLAVKTGYAYNIDGRTINWSVFVTKTFDISFMPGNSTYMVGDNQSGAAGGTSNSPVAGGASASAAAAGGGVGTNVGGTTTAEYSSLNGELSIWRDLRQSLNQLKSKTGRVMVSEATTSVTVRDYPENVRAIQTYLNQMNENLSREVMIQVQVLELKLDKQFSYGVNWNVVKNHVSLVGDMSKPLSATPIGSNSSNPAGVTLGILYGGVQTFINALQQQGDLSAATYPRVVTMNNQVAEVGINTQTTYVAQTSTSSNNISTTTAITPGVVTEGLTLYILPKIQGNKVYMQISSTLAQLLSMQTAQFGNNGATTSNGGIFGNNTNNQLPSSEIQLPQVSLKHFNQRSVVPTDATLVLAGFKQLRSQANKAALFGSYELGDRGAETDNEETIVLITPVIIRKGGYG